LKKALISPVLKAQRHLETRILVADGKYLVAKKYATFRRNFTYKKFQQFLRNKQARVFVRNHK